MFFSIPRNVLLRTWHDYNKYSIFFMCRQVITNNLMLNGIQYERNKRQFTPSLEIQDAVQEHWECFIAEFIKQVIAFGFAMVCISTDSAGRKYPRTVDPHLISIAVNIDNDGTTYIITSTEIDPQSVMVYDHFGFTPVMVGGKGVLTSIAWKVLPEIRFLSGLRNDCLLMEGNKGNPHFFATTHHDNKTKTEGIDFDYYADDGDKEIQNQMFTRNKIHIEVLNRQKDLYNQQMGYSVRATCKLENVVPLPTDTDIVSTPQNTGRQDIVQLHKVMQEMICTTLGVPRSMLIADGQYSSSTEGVKMLFDTTMKWWRKQTENTMTDLYTKIYITDTKPDSKPNSKPHKNIYLAKTRTQVRLLLPPSQDVDINQMTMLYEAGVLNWDMYSKTIMAQLQLSESGRNKSPPDTLQSIDPPQVLAMTHKRKRTTWGSDVSPTA